MVLDMDAAPESFFQSGNLDIRRITRSEDLADLLAVEQAVWNEDWRWLIVNLRKDLVENPEIVSIYVDIQAASPLPAPGRISIQGRILPHSGAVPPARNTAA